MDNMRNLEPFSVYSLSPVSNVCNQTLREAITFPNFSMAHVIMAPESISLLHKHKKMTEIYFILEGDGILYHNNSALKVEGSSYSLLVPNTPHKLKNFQNTLEHLVFAIPSFDQNDVELLPDNMSEMKPEVFSYNREPILALDGALIFELTSEEERKKFGIGLAVGNLLPGRRAIPHYHNKSDEFYYCISGVGAVRVGVNYFKMEKGMVIPVPKGRVHALENFSNLQDLSVLCLTSPEYKPNDFIFE